MKISKFFHRVNELDRKINFIIAIILMRRYKCTLHEAKVHYWSVIIVFFSPISLSNTSFSGPPPITRLSGYRQMTIHKVINYILSYSRNVLNFGTYFSIFPDVTFTYLQ